jgi:hypothetical protein
LEHFRRNSLTALASGNLIDSQEDFPSGPTQLSALRYLEDAGLSISQIAWLLGFQEVSAFTNAFRR